MRRDTAVKVNKGMRRPKVSMLSDEVLAKQIQIIKGIVLLEVISERNWRLATEIIMNYWLIDMNN